MPPPGPSPESFTTPSGLVIPSAFEVGAYGSPVGPETTGVRPSYEATQPLGHVASEGLGIVLIESSPSAPVPGVEAPVVDTAAEALKEAAERLEGATAALTALTAPKERPEAPPRPYFEPRPVDWAYDPTFEKPAFKRKEPAPGPPFTSRAPVPADPMERREHIVEKLSTVPSVRLADKSEFIAEDFMPRNRREKWFLHRVAGRQTRIAIHESDARNREYHYGDSDINGDYYLSRGLRYISRQGRTLDLPEGDLKLRDIWIKHYNDIATTTQEERLANGNHSSARIRAERRDARAFKRDHFAIWWKERANARAANVRFGHNWTRTMISDARLLGRIARNYTKLRATASPHDVVFPDGTLNPDFKDAEMQFHEMFSALDTD